MFGKQETDVLIAGGGPVGLFTALALARCGVRVKVLEEQWRSAARSYALALHPESLRLMSEFELGERLMEYGNRIRSLGLYDEGTKQVQVDLSTIAAEFPCILALPQQVLEELIQEALSREGVSVLWNHRLSTFETHPEGVIAKVEKLSKESTGYSVTRTEWVVDKTFDISAKFLVGADGHRSLVRRVLGIDFPLSGRSNTFAVFEFTADGTVGKELQIVLEEDSTSVLWPLPGGRYRWSFELEESVEELDPRVKSRLFVQFRDEPYPHVSEENLATLISQRAPWFDHPIGEVIWSAAIRFERRQAERYGEGRVWLVGDSAHLALPIGIQSMNIGFREAKDLADRLGSVCSGQAPVDSIKDYGDHWTSEWKALLELAESPPVGPEASEWVQSRADRIPLCIPASGQELKAILATLGLS